MSSSASSASRQRLDLVRARRLQPDLGHRVAEQLAVLGLVDGSAVAPIILTLNLSSTPILLERQRGVERGLPAHGRQQRVGALLLDDLGDDLRRDRLDVGGVGQVRVGHDRGRVRIHQHDPVALFLERLAGLGAGIVELAGLADDDRAGADDQDRFDVGAFRHRASNLAGKGTQKKGALLRVLRPGGEGPARWRLDQNRGLANPGTSRKTSCHQAFHKALAQRRNSLCMAGHPGATLPGLDATDTVLDLPILSCSAAAERHPWTQQRTNSSRPAARPSLSFSRRSSSPSWRKATAGPVSRLTSSPD